MRARLLMIATIILIGTFAFVQRGHRDTTPQDRDANPDRQVAVEQVDSDQVRRDAAELAQLAAGIPPDVAQATKGVLRKDLKDRLKRIEKLSKRLRAELRLD